MTTGVFPTICATDVAATRDFYVDPPSAEYAALYQEAVDGSG